MRRTKAIKNKKPNAGENLLRNLDTDEMELSTNHCRMTRLCVFFSARLALFFLCLFHLSEFCTVL